MFLPSLELSRSIRSQPTRGEGRSWGKAHAGAVQCSVSASKGGRCDGALDCTGLVDIQVGMLPGHLCKSKLVCSQALV